MTDAFFEKFPRIIYDGRECLNLMRRVGLTDNSRTDATLFHNYVLREGLREDVLSGDYYEEEDLSWILYLANAIVDPYFGWYVTSDELGKAIEKVYGSVSNAQRKIWAWRSNWHVDTQELSVANYNSDLTGKSKKYYQPIFGQAGAIISYKRRRDDIAVSTNKILKLTLDFEPIIGEVLSFENDAGIAEVDSRNGDNWYIKNVRGFVNQGDSVSGDESGETGTVTTVETLRIGIPVDEQDFYEAVSYYDLHVEKNERNKNIRLVKASLVDKVALDAERLING